MINITGDDSLTNTKSDDHKNKTFWMKVIFYSML